MLLNAPRVSSVSRCIVGKNRVFEGDIIGIGEDTSTNPACRIIGDRRVENGCGCTKSHCTAEFVEITNSKRRGIARKRTVSNRSRGISHPQPATLIIGFVASKGGVGNGQSLVGAVAQNRYPTTISRISTIGAACERHNFVILEGGFFQNYIVLAAGEQISCASFTLTFIVLKYAIGNLDCAGSFARIAGPVCVNSATVTP